MFRPVNDLYHCETVQYAYSKRSEYWLLVSTVPFGLYIFLLWPTRVALKKYLFWPSSLSLCVQDSCEYYFKHLERFCDKDFVPTEEDVVMARVRTTGKPLLHFCWLLSRGFFLPVLISCCLRSCSCSPTQVLWPRTWSKRLLKPCQESPPPCIFRWWMWEDSETSVRSGCTVLMMSSVFYFWSTWLVTIRCCLKTILRTVCTSRWNYSTPLWTRYCFFSLPSFLPYVAHLISSGPFVLIFVLHSVFCRICFRKSQSFSSSTRRICLSPWFWYVLLLTFPSFTRILLAVLCRSFSCAVILFHRSLFCFAFYRRWTWTSPSPSIPEARISRMLWISSKPRSRSKCRLADKPTCKPSRARGRETWSARSKKWRRRYMIWIAR